jgi:hypothetical protein
MKNGWMWATLAASVGAVWLIRRAGPRLPDAPVTWHPYEPADDVTEEEAQAPSPVYDAPSYGGYAL